MFPSIFFTIFLTTKSRQSWIIKFLKRSAAAITDQLTRAHFTEFSPKEIKCWPVTYPKRSFAASRRTFPISREAMQQETTWHGHHLYTQKGFDSARFADQECTANNNYFLFINSTTNAFYYSRGRATTRLFRRLLVVWNYREQIRTFFCLASCGFLSIFVYRRLRCDPFYSWPEHLRQTRSHLYILANYSFVFFHAAPEIVRIKFLFVLYSFTRPNTRTNQIRAVFANKSERSEPDSSFGSKRTYNPSSVTDWPGGNVL